MSVQDVARHPGLVCVLWRFGLATDDARTLTESASDKGLPIELLMAALDKASVVTTAAGGIDEKQFQAELQEVITEYIEERFHSSLRSELLRLENLLNEAAATHSRTHGATLGALKAVFMPFKAQIEEHLAIEEQLLFPQLRNTEQCTRSGHTSVELPLRSSPLTAIDEMQREHDLVGWAVKEMRALTRDYTFPADESGVLAALYEGLAALEADLQEHIRLENDFLWPARLMNQTPPDADSPAEEASSSVLDDVFVCPWTNQPCESNLAALCDKFWDCVREAMKQRWDKVDSQNTEPSST